MRAPYLVATPGRRVREQSVAVLARQLDMLLLADLDIVCAICLEDERPGCGTDLQVCPVTQILPRSPCTLSATQSCSSAR